MMISSSYFTIFFLLISILDYQGSTSSWFGLNSKQCQYFECMNETVDTDIHPKVQITLNPVRIVEGGCEVLAVCFITVYCLRGDSVCGALDPAARAPVRAPAHARAVHAHAVAGAHRHALLDAAARTLPRPRPGA